MRILYILSGTTITDGSTKSLLSLLHYVMDHGHEVAVVCPNKTGVYQSLIKDKINTFSENYKGINIPVQCKKDIIKWLPRYIKYKLINIKAKITLLKQVKYFSPDLIHENTSYTDIGRYLSLRLNCRYLMHIREYSEGFYLSGIKKILSSYDVNTVTITKLLAKKYPRPYNELNRVIYDGIIRCDNIRYNPNKQNYILYAGRIEENKGIKDLIDAYIIYAKNNKNPLRMVIAGEPTFALFGDLLKKKVSENELEALVDWVGLVDNIDDLAYNATVSVIPSYFEGLGRVMPEAMANGCLCIARNTTGSKEQMDNGFDLTSHEIAFRFENNDQLVRILNEITKTILVEKPFEGGGKYWGMIMKSQQSIKKYFTEEASGKLFLEYYEEIISK